MKKKEVLHQIKHQTKLLWIYRGEKDYRKIDYTRHILKLLKKRLKMYG